MGKSALKPAPTSTTHSATNTAVNTTHTQNGTSTPKKRVDKVVTARPVTTETKPSPKIDLNPSKSVTETIKAIDEQIAKENGANESNIAATHSEQPQPSEQTVQLKQTPKAPVQVDDKRQVTIEWTPHMGSTVFITGSFCDWKQKHPVSTEGGSYKVTLPLPPGKHVFKFVVDGEWFYDITQPTETDAEGNVNNVITV